MATAICAGPVRRLYNSGASTILVYNLLALAAILAQRLLSPANRPSTVCAWALHVRCRLSGTPQACLLKNQKSITAVQWIRFLRYDEECAKEGVLCCDVRNAVLNAAVCCTLLWASIIINPAQVSQVFEASGPLRRDGIRPLNGCSELHLHQQLGTIIPSTKKPAGGAEPGRYMYLHESSAVH